MAAGSDADVGLRLRLFGRQEVRTGLRDTQDDLEDTASVGERAARSLASIGDRGIAAGIRGVGNVAKVAAAGLAITAGAAIGVGKALYDVGATFDDVSDTIRAGTGAQGADLEGLNAVALNIGKTVPASFEDIGSTVADVAQRTGLTGDALQQVSSQMLALKNLGFDADVNTITGAMAAYGVKAADTSGVLDELFQVSQATGVGVNELATAAQTGAPALTQFGFSIGDAAALIGTLDKAGVDSSGTIGALRKGLGAFAKAGKDPQQALRDTVAGIEQLTQSGKDAEAINLAGSVFGTKGAAQFVAAVKSGKVNLDALTEGVGASDDTILGLASETADFAEQWQLFKNVLLVGVKPAGDYVFGAIGTYMGQITDGVRTLSGTELPTLQSNLSGLFSSGDIGALGPQLESAFKLPPGTVSGLQEPLDAVVAKGQQIATVLVTAWDGLRSIPISPLNLANDALGWASEHTQALKVGVVAIASAYIVARAVLLGYAIAQAASNIATGISTVLIGANNAVYAASRSYIATWIGVKALELGAWIRGTAATAASTLAMGAQKLAYGVGYLSTWIGVKGLELGAWLRSTAATAASTAAMGAQKIAYGVGYLTTFVGVKGLEFAAWARTTAATLASSAASLAAAAASGIVRGAVIAWTAGQWLLNAALSANPIGLVVAAIALLIGGLVLAWQHSETFRTVVMAAWAGIQAAASAVAGWFTGTLVPTVVGVFQAVRDAVGGALSWISDHWRTIASIIGGPLVAVILNFDQVKAAGIAVFDRIRDAVGGFVTKIQNGIDKVKALGDAVKNSAVGQFVSGAASGIQGLFAAGGTVYSGQGPAIVGEQGPELFLPGVTGQVVPSDALASMLSTPVPMARHASVASFDGPDLDDDLANELDSIALEVVLNVDGRELARSTVNGLHANAAWT